MKRSAYLELLVYIPTFLKLFETWRELEMILDLELGTNSAVYIPIARLHLPLQFRYLCILLSPFRSNPYLLLPTNWSSVRYLHCTRSDIVFLLI
jgi:hypothetical protein